MTIIPGLYGLDAATAWRVLEKDPNKYITKFSEDKAVQREIEYFEKKAPKITSIDELMKDRRLLQFVLDAHGLGSEINNAGRIKKILSENPNDSSALANKLLDPRFKALAESLRLDRDFKSFELKIKRETLIEGYVKNEFEQALGEQDAALRQAAYFARSASSISDVYAILGDRILRDVVTTTFNIPPQLAIQPIESQAATISRRIDVTKFSGLVNSSVTPTQIDRAKSDYSLLETNLKISDAAVTQIKTLSDQLSQLSANYSNLTTVTDPGGANAALIAVQEVAVPELVRAEQLIRAGGEAYDKVGGYLGFMEDLIAQASDSSSDLVSLKAQFNSYVNSITNALNNADVQVPDGSTENILLHGADDTMTIVLDDSGTEFTFNRYDISDIQNAIASAQTAFNNIADSSDSANILAAQGRVLVAQDSLNVVGETLVTDIEALNDVANSYFAAASLNSSALVDGKRSVDDALNRISQIEDLLEQVGELAVESKNRLPSADRSDLETEFNALRDQIRDLIENASDPSFENFLNNIPDQTYEVINGQTIRVKGGYDLATAISNVLDTGSLSDTASAATLEITAIQVTTATDAAKEGLNREKPILDRVVNFYDPQGQLDSQIYDLKQQLTAAISASAVDGKNLLSSEQSDIKLGALSTGKDITFRSQPTFEADVLAAIDDLLAEIGNGSAAIVSALDDVAYLVDSAKRRLESDNRTGTLELGKLAGVIDVLNGGNTTDSENPYKVNEFTQKFLVRYLTQVQLNNGFGTSGANSYVSTLFGNIQNGNAGAMSNLMSLSLQI